MIEIEIYNSFCKIVAGRDSQVDSMLIELLTYKNDIEADKGAIFNRMRWAKRNKDAARIKALQKELLKLEATETVCWYLDGAFPTGLLNIVERGIQYLNKPFTRIEKRVVPVRDQILPWRNKPFDPRYYQVEAIEAALTHGRGVIESAVGTGKSLMMAYIVKALATVNLIVVPSVNLGQQMYDDFCIWFGTNKVDLLDAKKVRLHHANGRKLAPIRLITVSSLGSLLDSGELDLIISDVSAIYLDEYHHAASMGYLRLLPRINHIYYRFGFTGTFLRNDNKILDMVVLIKPYLPIHGKASYCRRVLNTLHRVRAYRSWGA